MVLICSLIEAPICIKPLELTSRCCAVVAAANAFLRIVNIVVSQVLTTADQVDFFFLLDNFYADFGPTSAGLYQTLPVILVGNCFCV